jgi:hypothetical protein
LSCTATVKAVPVLPAVMAKELAASSLLTTVTTGVSSLSVMFTVALFAAPILTSALPEVIPVNVTTTVSNAIRYLS